MQHNNPKLPARLDRATLLPRVGRMEQGPLNLITDVPGLRVGHVTLAEGPVQTGVTAILPHGGNCFEEKKLIQTAYTYEQSRKEN